MWWRGVWPDDRSVVDNLRDLQAHADDFENRAGFTYTVLDPATGDYPRTRGGAGLAPFASANPSELSSQVRPRNAPAG